MLSLSRNGLLYFLSTKCWQYIKRYCSNIRSQVEPYSEPNLQVIGLVAQQIVEVIKIPLKHANNFSTHLPLCDFFPAYRSFIDPLHL